MRTALYLIALGCTALVGCHAEVRTKADFSASARGDSHAVDDDEWSTSDPEPSEPAETKALQQAKASTTPTRAAFIGVTPDLTLAPSSSRTPACMCLAVAHGEPGDPAFEWQGGTPTAIESAMAIAISGEGIPCKWDSKGETSPIPSIAAVERSGQDVVVTIEPAQAGRPVMRGAMILRPGPKGDLILKGSGRVPFGRPIDGSVGTCRVPVK